MLAHKLERNNRWKDWWIPDKTVTISNGSRSLMTRDISSNPRRQIPYVSTLE